MTKSYTPETRQPSIVKYSQSERVGIQPQNMTRQAIGYVIRGKKFIYSGDVANQVNSGDLFYLSAGHHYMEDIPENNRPFEQIFFYFTPEQLSHNLSQLSVNFGGLSIDQHHSCDNCHGKNFVIFPAWRTIRSFFYSLNQYIKDGLITGNSTPDSLKMMELIYLIVSNPNCCIQNKIMAHSDTIKESFEQTIQKNIFNDVSIEELAQQTNRSLTSFKKEFKRQFFEPPHKWLIKQRLIHSRLLLISTSKSIAEIGTECNFPNPSHFIKLFKKEFGFTPSVYRNRHIERNVPTAAAQTVSPTH